MEKFLAFTAGHTVPRLIRERRWWLLLLLAWAAVIGLSIYHQREQVRQQTTTVAIEGARNMFRMVMLTRNWNARHGGVYVPVTPRTQPNPYLKSPLRDVLTTDGVALTLVNPAYMTRLIGEMAEPASGAIFRLTSLRPIRPANAPDAWERRALQAFDKGLTEVVGVESRGDGDMLRYMAPLAVGESCLQCHREQGYKVGDIRGGLSVSQRNAPIETAVQAGLHKLLFIHGAVFLLVGSAGWGLLEVLRRRWLDLGGKIAELEEAHVPVAAVGEDGVHRPAGGGRGP